MQTLCGSIQTLTILSSSFVAIIRFNLQQHQHHHQHRYFWTPILMVMVAVAERRRCCVFFYENAIGNLLYNIYADSCNRVSHTTATFSIFWASSFLSGDFPNISINKNRSTEGCWRAGKGRGRAKARPRVRTNMFGSNFD